MSRPVLPVGLVASYVAQVLDADELLSDFWVEGEVSRVFAAASGHLYLTLKDSDSSLKVMMPRSSAARQRYLPSTGEAIVAHGRVAVYERDGTIQLYADIFQPAGVGELALHFERLRLRLEAEGLFDESRKRPLPAAPQVIGVATSPHGAVWQDIRQVVGRRYPLTRLVLAPTSVQGQDAPVGVIAALDRLQAMPEVEVVIIARGGGSPEDLTAFNDERLARAIFACRVPVISAIGHETDWSISDWVADLRAPTPTAAAELAVPSLLSISEDIADLEIRLARVMVAGLVSHRSELTTVKRRFLRIDHRSAIDAAQERQRDLIARLSRGVERELEISRERIGRSALALDLLDPRHVLSRGYAAVSVDSGGPVTSAVEARNSENLTLTFQDGRVSVTVDDYQLGQLRERR